MSSTKSTSQTEVLSLEEVRKNLDEEVEALNQLAIRLAPMLLEYANRRSRADELVKELEKRALP